ncbi:DUF4918 family protein [Acinetobacter sp. CUI P1]|nr:DUF4918 family protein [Acinetobacter sp. CUI P1]
MDILRYKSLLRHQKKFIFDFQKYAEPITDSFYAKMNFVNPLAVNWKSYMNFFENYYDPTVKKRNLIVGLNPGKNGANKTGVPFTDPTNAHDHLGMANCKSDTVRESSSEKLFPLFLKSFNGDMHAFFNHYHLANILPYGVTQRKTFETNVGFLELMKIPQLKKEAEYNLENMISIFAPEYIIAVGSKSYDFIRKFVHRNYDNIIVVQGAHPSRDSQFTEIEKRRWLYLLKKLLI